MGRHASAIGACSRVFAGNPFTTWAAGRSSRSMSSRWESAYLFDITLICCPLSPQLPYFIVVSGRCERGTSWAFGAVSVEILRSAKGSAQKSKGQTPHHLGAGGFRAKGGRMPDILEQDHSLCLYGDTHLPLVHPCRQVAGPPGQHAGCGCRHRC